MQYTNYKTDYGEPVPNPTLPGSTPAENAQQQSTFGPPVSGQPQYRQPIVTQPQYGQPKAGQPQGVLVVPSLILITQEHFRPYETKCPHCHAQITTETKFVIGHAANICFIMLFFSFIWVGLFCCAFIPCFTKSMKDVRHSCPHCRKVVAEYQRHRISPEYQTPWLRCVGSEVPTINWQGGYGQNQQEAPPGILIVQPRPPVTEQHFRSYPTTCPHCHSQITTEIAFHVGDFVWYWVIILTCILTLFGLICFIWIPCCVNRCKDVKHTCPRCNKMVAEYLRHEKLY